MNSKTPQGTLGAVVLLTLGLFAYIHGLTLYAGLHPATEVGRYLISGIFLMFAGLGNIMGRVRRNFYIGVRTPWTIASERVWADTHRLAAWLFTGAGVMGFGLSLAGWLMPSLILLAVAALVPVGFSLVRYKQLERQGLLGS